MNLHISAELKAFSTYGAVTSVINYSIESVRNLEIPGIFGNS